MTEKHFKTRMQQKHDTEENWSRAETFVPYKGEIIVYDIDDKYLYERFKIGDGKSLLKDLPFMGQTTVQIITWEDND